MSSASAGPVAQIRTATIEGASLLVALRMGLLLSAGFVALVLCTRPYHVRRRDAVGRFDHGESLAQAIAAARRRCEALLVHVELSIAFRCRPFPCHAARLLRALGARRLVLAGFLV